MLADRPNFRTTSSRVISPLLIRSHRWFRKLIPLSDQAGEQGDDAILALAFALHPLAVPSGFLRRGRMLVWTVSVEKRSGGAVKAIAPLK